MRNPLALRGVALAAVFSAFALSCELSSGFLSESERSSLYTVTLSAGESSLKDGSFLDPGSAISASVSKLTGAESPSFLDFSIEGTGVAQRLAASSAKAPATAGTSPAARTVSAIDGSLPVADLPGDLTPGAYALSVKLSAAEGRVLQALDLVVFIGLAPARIESVSVYPPSVEPGQALLLSASVATGGNPWIRWSRDGVAFAEGPLSEGRDRVVWIAPRAEGAYSLAVEAFPAAPPAGREFAFDSSSRRDFKVMVKSTSEASADEFADPLQFYSLLRFDGTFEDQGVRPRDAQPSPFGQPSLDIYPSVPGYQSGFGKLGGFGYLFGERSGVRIPGLMPPLAQGRLLPFSVAIRVCPRASTGYLVRFASADGAAFLLEIGLREGKPSVSAAIGGETASSIAATVLPQEPRTIVVSLEPGSASTRVFWNIEGERFEAQPLPPLPSPPAGSAILGGPDSLAGVYDAFGVMAPAAPPSYRLVAARKWRARLAEAFEDGLLPPRSEAEGKVKPDRGAVAFEGSASLTFGGSLRLDRPLLVEADFSGDLAAVALSLATRQGERVFSIDGLGAVRGSEGDSLGALPSTGGKLTFLLVAEQGALRLSSPDRLASVSVRAAAEGEPCSISVGTTDAPGTGALSRILVREAAPSTAR